MTFRHSLRCTLFAAVLAPLGIARAQTTAPAGPTLTAFTISPKPSEKPALAYALLPNFADTEPGNAALKYQLALDIYLSTHDNVVAKHKDWDETVSHLREVPLAELDEAKATDILNNFKNPLALLSDGAHMDSISWGTNIRKDGFTTLLPYLSPVRALSGLLAISIRLDIKRHRWQEAQQKLQVGYQVAHQFGQCDTIIEVLVGNAIAGQMNNCLQDWISEPGSPNLFWPIANLPQPFNTLRYAATFERDVTRLNFPEWKSLAAGTATPEQLSSFTRRFQTVSHGINPENYASDRESMEAEKSFLGLALAVGEYPAAKRYLIDHGISAEEVEKRPVSGVVGEYFTRTYDEAADEIFKWFSLPTPQALRGLAAADAAFREQQRNNTANLLSRILLPSLGRASLVTARIDRQLNALRIAEALRAYAAVHNTLPDSLDQLDTVDLPIPLDPISAQPFTFEHHGNTVTLTAPPAPGDPSPKNANRYEFTLRSN